MVGGGIIDNPWRNPGGGIPPKPDIVLDKRNFN
jgi:hypothetical protein